MNDVVMGQSVLEARGLTKRFAEGKLDLETRQLAQWLPSKSGRT
ncbi:hypothetical protein [Comamonas thiooxydans]